MRKSLSTLSTELSPSVAIEIPCSTAQDWHVGTTAPRAHMSVCSTAEDLHPLV